MCRAFSALPSFSMGQPRPSAWASMCRAFSPLPHCWPEKGTASRRLKGRRPKKDNDGDSARRVRMTTWVEDDVGRDRARTASRGAELSRWTRGKADVVYVADAFEVMTRQTLC